MDQAFPRFPEKRADPPVRPGTDPDHLRNQGFESAGNVVQHGFSPAQGEETGQGEDARDDQGGIVQMQPRTALAAAFAAATAGRRKWWRFQNNCFPGMLRDRGEIARFAFAWN